MENKEYQRKLKGDQPVLAICYDFDKTLTPDDMQAQGFIQSVEYDISEFWKKSNGLAESNDMDQNLAYMYTMIDASEGHFVFNREKLAEYGSKVQLFPGVKDWFTRIREYGKSYGVIVEHYIISSGLKEMIEGTSVAKSGAFEKIYASSFYYNDKGVAKWPAQVINYTNKTQFLFRIEKGVLDINDQGVNESFAPEDVRVPFRNMVYIGDSDTDIPCMKLVNSYGGYSIGVYNHRTEDKTKVYKMMHDNRIKYYAASDYSENSELDKLVKLIIKRTAANENIEDFHYSCKKENIEADTKNSEEKRKKTSLLISLDNSGNFKTTHAIVKNLSQVGTWDTNEKETLFEIALDNSQVFSLLGDHDVKSFFRSLLQGMSGLSENAKKVKAQIDK